MELQLNPNNPHILTTRIAPTPSGYLHIGNVFSFALTWALARKQNGKVILRIDDLDSTRFREEYLQDIFDTLHFLGIDYDEGPDDAADFHENYSQKIHLPFYDAVLQKLATKGMVYACPCSRTQLAGRIQEGKYPFTCRNKQHPLDLNNAAWRLRTPEETIISFNDLLLKCCNIQLSDHIPDFIVRRKDGIPAYQIASLCDDLRMGVNLIVRGEDLLSSTAAQLYLARVLGKVSFGEVLFLHHPVLNDINGKKLSKSHDSLSIKEMRRNGATAGDIWKQIAGYMNVQEEDITDAQKFLDKSSLDNLVVESCAGSSERSYCQDR